MFEIYHHASTEAVIDGLILPAATIEKIIAEPSDQFVSMRSSKKMVVASPTIEPIDILAA